MDTLAGMERGGGGSERGSVAGILLYKRAALRTACMSRIKNRRGVATLSPSKEEMRRLIGRVTRTARREVHPRTTERKERREKKRQKEKKERSHREHARTHAHVVTCQPTISKLQASEVSLSAAETDVNTMRKKAYAGTDTERERETSMSHKTHGLPTRHPED